jgi:hypothetical protein
VVVVVGVVVVASVVVVVISTGGVTLNINHLNLAFLTLIFHSLWGIVIAATTAVAWRT